MRTRFGRMAAGTLAMVAIVVQATGCATELGTLGGPGSDAVASNTAGVVVGSSTTSPEGGMRAFVWDAVNGMRAIDPTNPTGSAAVDVSDSGLVLLNEGPPLQSVVTVWDLGTNTKRSSWGSGAALAVNNAGSVLMTSPEFSRTPPNQILVLRLRHADGSSDLVPMIAALATSIRGEPGRLNNRGEVVGEATVDGATRPAVWSKADGLRLLDVPAGFTGASARSINDHGVVVGSAIDSALGQSVGVSWPSATGPMTRQADLGTAAVLVDVNDDGVAIGTSATAEGPVPYWVRIGATTAAPAPAGAQWRSIGDDGFVLGWIEGRATRWYLGGPAS